MFKAYMNKDKKITQIIKYIYVNKSAQLKAYLANTLNLYFYFFKHLHNIYLFYNIMILTNITS